MLLCVMATVARIEIPTPDLTGSLARSTARDDRRAGSGARGCGEPGPRREPQPGELQPPESHPRGPLPGLLLAGTVALVASVLASLLTASGFVASAMVVALLLGLVLAQLRPLPVATVPGLDFACRPVLRFAIVLLGLRIGLPQVAAVGVVGLLEVSLIVASTLGFGYWLCRRLGMSQNLAWLLASGHAICGAAAIAAADSVLKAKEREVTQALTMVTLFGTVLMLLLPVAGSWLRLDADSYGWLVGGSVHEVAQAVAAGYARGEQCGASASIVKLVRVTHLLPLGLLLGLVVARRGRRTGAASSGGGSGSRIVVPWFVVGFAAVAVFDALGWVPVALADALRQLCTFAMTLAMAALGLKSSLRDVLRGGSKPLVAAGLLTAWIVAVAALLA